MKKPKLDRFLPQAQSRIQPEAVDFSGAPKIKPHPDAGQPQTLFPTPPSQPLPSANQNIDSSQPTQVDEPASQQANQLASKQTSNMTNNIAIQMASNIAILQSDLQKYILTPYKAQTFRFTPEELRHLKDWSYILSNALDKKIGQADLVRLGLLLLERHLEENRDAIDAILQASK